MNIKGFTLAEIMVTVSVIALIAAIAIPSYLRGSESAKRNLCIANLKIIDKTKSLWALKEGMFSDDVPEWGELIPEYIKKTPVCPSGGRYTIGSVVEKPTCSIEEHKLP